MKVDHRVRDLMTSKPRTARPHDTASELDVWMTAGQFRHLPVVDDNGQLVGIVSRRGVARATGGTKARPGHLECIFAYQIMSAPVETIGPDEPLGEAARRMMDGKSAACWSSTARLSSVS